MDQITQIKQKIDIVDLIGSYVTLKKSGRNYKGLCPFHSEKTPSFMVSPELQIFKCFGCGESGDIFAFVQKVEGIEFPSALENLAERAGIKLEKRDYDPSASVNKQIYKVNEYATRFYQYLLLEHKIGKSALDYLTKQRGLNIDTIKEFRMGYAPDNWDTLYKFLIKKEFNDQIIFTSGLVTKSEKGNYIDKFRGRVVFPFVGLDNKVIAFNGRTVVSKEPKYLNTSETPVFHKATFLFGLDKAKLEIKKQGVIFVEGQLDVISAYQAGIKNVVASSGTALTQEQLKVIQRYTKDIIFCFDSDLAGINAAYRAISLSENMGFNVNVVMIPSPYKDLDELIKSEKDKAISIVNNPISAYDFFLAASLKKHDKNKAIGKKSIMEELMPLFSRISNQVLLDHYTKQISKELDISQETIYKMLSENSSDSKEGWSSFDKIVETSNVSSVSISKTNYEAYLITLLLKANLDSAKKFVYKLSADDFSNEAIKQLITVLREYLKDRKSDINIKTLVNDVPEEYRGFLNDLYLWDLENVVDPQDYSAIDREIEKVFDRIKTLSVKRQIKELTEKMKIAEMQKDTELILKLTDRVKKLSKRLI